MNDVLLFFCQEKGRNEKSKVKVDDAGGDEPPPGRELEKRKRESCTLAMLVVLSFLIYLMNGRLICQFLFFCSGFRMKRVHRPSLERGFLIFFFRI